MNKLNKLDKLDIRELKHLNPHKIVMSNLANYSPYNKTYKFLMFQNQAYHQKNKRNVKPCVRTNLRYAKSQNHSYNNPELNQSQLYQKPQTADGVDVIRCSSPSTSVGRSMLFSSRSLRDSNPFIAKPKRVIHKHQSFEKFQSMRINKANSKLVSRLVSTSCQVIKKQKSAKSFNNHLKYRQIRNKYDAQGNRKHGLAVGNQILLCPTLKQFNQSGLASKFIEQNLSWSKISTPRPRLHKKASNLSCNQ